MDRKLGFRVFRATVKYLSGKGLTKLPLVRKTYHLLGKHLIGEGIVPVDVCGQKMYADLSFRLMLLPTGTYERMTTNLFTKLVTEGMIVIDIGANIGYYTLLAAKAVGNNGRVFCFEPEPSNYALLLKNIKENNHGNVTPVKKAVTNTTGVVKLFISKEPGQHSIASDNLHQRAISVDSTTLDDFFVGKEYPIHAIKMDIEGAELATFQGMRNIIAKNPQLVIFTEFNPRCLMMAGASPTEYFQMLINYGFKIHAIDEQKQSLEPAELGHIMKRCKGIETVNLLCQR